MERLLDRSWPPPPGLALENPLLLGPNAPGRAIAYRDPERGAVAIAAWRPLTLLSGRRRLRACGIGLVTTDPRFRGRGLASRLVQACLLDARAAGAELALLFGEPRELYRRLGFVPAGRERLCSIHPDPAARVHVRVGRGGDALRLAHLLERQPLRVERSAAEFAAQLQVRETGLFVLERTGEPRAYCVVGRGRDLGGVIHEWAGEPEALARLLPAVAARSGRPLGLLAPADLPSPASDRGRVQPMAQLCILRPEGLGGDDPVELFGDPVRRARIPIYVWGLDSV